MALMGKIEKSFKVSSARHERARHVNARIGGKKARTKQRAFLKKRREQKASKTFKKRGKIAKLAGTLKLMARQLGKDCPEVCSKADVQDFEACFENLEKKAKVGAPLLNEPRYLTGVLPREFGNVHTALSKVLCKHEDIFAHSGRKLTLANIEQLVGLTSGLKSAVLKLQKQAKAEHARGMSDY